MPRKLRIAVSVFFGLLTVALCVLWVRSYHRYEYVALFVMASQSSKHVAFVSNCGYLTIYHMESRLPSSTALTGGPSTIHWAMKSTAANCEVPKHYVETCQGYIGINVPYPFAATVTLIVAALPYYNVRRFTLRTLLIATTLLALVLGLGVWLAR